MSDLLVLIYFAVFVMVIAAQWVTFTKAGEPGWAAIVPFYNLWVMIRIAGRPAIWFLLALIPLVNIVIGIMLMIEFARAFGKGPGFGFGLMFLGFIFWPMLAWGDATYTKPEPA